MNEHSLAFLRQLLSTPGPSSNEATVARLWRDEADTFADEVYADVHGNSYARLRGAEPQVLLTGHIDEIGLMISYIADDGFLYFDTIGGWDAQVLVGQRVRLLGRHGDVLGVIGKKPVHMMESEERGSASKVSSLWIDIGAHSRREVLEQVRVGTVGVIDAPCYELANRRMVSRSLDNRIGAFVVLEALRLLSQDRPAASVTAVATTQEEVGAAGAAVAAYRLEPHVALVVDVTFATDHPQADPRKTGDVKLGGGPALARGGANSALLYERLLDVAEREAIPYALEITPGRTGTDADRIYTARAGVAIGMISIPCRYMHSPNEMIDQTDVEHAARLIAAFVRSLQSEHEFIPT
jgi:endoglucanase